MDGKSALATLLLFQALIGIGMILIGAKSNDEKVKDTNMYQGLMLVWMAFVFFADAITTIYTLELTVGRGVKEITSYLLMFSGSAACILAVLVMLKRISMRPLWILTGVIMLFLPPIVFVLSRF